MGLTNETYFEQDEYMTVSQFKRYEKCEELGKKGFGDDKSEALLFGSYVDAYVEGTLEQFKADNPEMFVETIAMADDTIERFKAVAPEYVTRNDTMVSKKLSEAKKKYKQFFDVTYKLKAVYKLADEICEYIDNDPIFSKFMSGDKQTIMTGEIGGVPFKIKMDSYSEGIAINDLKVMWKIRDKDGQYIDFITPWGYDIQLAVYQEIVRQNTGKKLPCYICAVPKSKPIKGVVVNIPQTVLDTALYRVSSTVSTYYEVKMDCREAHGCGTCEVCMEKYDGAEIISLYDITGG